MPEAHQAERVVLVLGPVDERGGVTVGVADLRQHLQDGLVGAAVQRAPQRVDARRDGGEHVDLRRADQAHGRGGGVLLVVGVQDVQQVQRLGDLGVDLVGLGLHAEHHVEEVGGVAQLVPGIDERLPDGLLVRPRRDRRHLGHEAVDRHLDVPLVLGVVVVLVERRQAGRGGGEDRHRVGALGERVEELPHVLVEQRVDGDLLLEVVQLRLGGQLTEDQQVGHLQEVGGLRQLLDRVAAVAQDARLTVEVGDVASAGGGGGEAGVVGGQPGGPTQAGGVDAAITFGSLDHRCFEVIAFQLDACVVSHGRCLWVGAYRGIRVAVGSHVRRWRM